MPARLQITDEERKERKREAARRWRAANSAKTAEYMREWRKSNPNWHADYRAKNPDKVRAANKKWVENNPEKASRHWKKTAVKKRFGLTVEEYDALLQAQGGACYICGEVKPKMDLDHNHVTGALRKFLCSPCNLLVGNIEKNQAKLQAVFGYLEEHS